jgi:hypothetical protein
VILIVALVIFPVITASHIPWFLSNNKLVYAAQASAPIRANVRTPYPIITSARLTNKSTTAAAAATTAEPSASLSSKALPSVTRSLSSIVTKVKERNDNNNIESSNDNLTKSHNSSFIPITNHYIGSKPTNTKSSVFPNTVHNTISSNDKNIYIAFIKPSFTAAAYHHSFYVFYTLYKNAPQRANVTTDLNLLTSKVTDQTTDSSPSAFAMSYLSKNIQSLIPRAKIVMLTDADIDAGNIFTEKNKYDILIIGHQEYVTQHEYDNLRQFVSQGGTMVILDGNIFYAEVRYDRDANTITLVKGHGWAFNGRSAWKSVAERWKEETSEWTGSNYLCYSCSIIFDNDPFEYKHHEEQYITNPNDVILFNYNASMPGHHGDNDDNNGKPSPVSSTTSLTTSLLPPSSQLLPSSKGDDITTKHIIATYELKYQRGKVIALGIYSDDIITNNKFDTYFDNLLLRYVI